MRDNFNISALSNNMFANLNTLIPVPDLPAVVTNISTNVYYGYQPLPAQKEYKEINVMESFEMDIQFNCILENHANIQENTRVFNRKRRCPEQQDNEFKKRRQNEDKMVIQSAKNWELNLEEELLKHTHGISSYQWRNETNL